jgi:hypothetical protein
VKLEPVFGSANDADKTKPMTKTSPSLSGTVVFLVVWPYYVNDFYLMAIPPSSQVLLWSLDLIFYTATPVITLAFFLFQNRISLSTLGLTRPLRFRTVAAGAVLGVVLLFSVHWNVEPILVTSFPRGPFHGYQFPPSGVQRLVLISYAVLSAALLEEAIFRGLVVRYLESRISGSLTVVMVASLLFGLMHWSQGIGFVLAMALWAVIPTIWAMHSRRVWGPIIAHIVYYLLVLYA